MEILRKLRESGTIIGLFAYMLTGISALFLTLITALLVDQASSVLFLNIYALIGVFSYFTCYGRQFELLKIGHQSKNLGIKNSHENSQSLFENILFLQKIHLYVSPLVIGLIFILLKEKHSSFQILTVFLAILLQSNSRVISHFFIGSGNFKVASQIQIVRSASLLLIGTGAIIEHFEYINLPAIFILSEFIAIIFVTAKIKRLFASYRPKFRKLTQTNFVSNVMLMTGDVTFEFGPKIQIILASYFLDQTIQHFMVYLFLIIEVFIQVSLVFRGRFNSTLERFINDGDDGEYSHYVYGFKSSYNAVQLGAFSGLCLLSFILIFFQFISWEYLSTIILTLITCALIYGLRKNLLFTQIFILLRKETYYLQVNLFSICAIFSAWLFFLPVLGAVTPVVSFSLAIIVNAFFIKRYLNKAGIKLKI